ncbi:MAG: hypothetical protein L6R38_006764 [Xanthoria sp. 2 TBL-2021]|nr:MAG: hypothetical protein L6R38_006764 [Xanthoria sp. 2 TBL-2021]
MDFINTSSSAIKAQATPRRILPKRKRKETSYFPSDSESDLEGGDAEEYDSEIVGAPSAKKAKAPPAVQPPKPLPKKKIFPFASLPAELKNKIYSYALTSDEPIYLISKRKHHYRHTIALGDTDSFGKDGRRGSYGYIRQNDNPVIRKPPLVPQFLVLNRQIHAETQPILYGANIFAVEDMKALHTFLANIGPKNCETLQQLSIKQLGHSRSTSSLAYPAFVLLANAVNLTRLEMDCAISWGEGDRIGRAFWREAHHWIESIGRHKGRRDAALDIVDLTTKNVSLWLERSGKTKEQLLDEIRADFRAELRGLLKL